MYYLSIDCANKSLAIGFYSINNLNNWKINLLTILRNKTFNNYEKITESNKLLDSIFDIHFLKVLDITNNQKVKDTSIINRSICLKNNISKIKNDILNITGETKLNILIEYQMNANDKSRTVFNQLIYAFSQPNYYNIYIIVPTLKNKIYFKDELKHCRILQRYSKNYTANKVHCKENFLYFLEIFNKLNVVENIPKKNIDDVADTFMQLVGYIKYY